MNNLPVAPPPQRPSLELFVWGVSSEGQLGLPKNIRIDDDWVYKPKRNLLLEQHAADGRFGEPGDVEAGLEAIAAGGMHTLFIDENGTIWSCGVNDSGALGRSTEEGEGQAEGVFARIQSLIDEHFRAVQVVAGDNISAALSDTGDMRIWGSFRTAEGNNLFSPTIATQFVPSPLPSVPHPLSCLAAGVNHLVLLTQSGQVYTMGIASEGQLGRRTSPRTNLQAYNWTMPKRIILGNNRANRATVVGAGESCSFAVDEDGIVWGWGVNFVGQTGTGIALSLDEKIVQQPRRVQLDGLDAEERIVQIVGGQSHTVFRSSLGRIYVCGLADEGRLGLAKDNPQLIAGLVQTPRGSILEFPSRVMLPSLVQDHPDVAGEGEEDPAIDASCGQNHTLVVTASGAMYVWGRQVTAELGLGRNNVSVDSQGVAELPTVVVRQSEGSWRAVKCAAGGQHGVALLRRRVA